MFTLAYGGVLNIFILVRHKLTKLAFTFVSSTVLNMTPSHCIAICSTFPHLLLLQDLIYPSTSFTLKMETTSYTDMMEQFSIQCMKMQQQK